VSWRSNTRSTAPAEDLLAFTSLPTAHWKKIWSTNPLERLNKEVNAASMSSECSRTRKRCCGWPERCWSKPTIEWQATDRRYLGEATMALLASPPTEHKVAPSELMTLGPSRPR
jgi:putative transposase